MDSLSSADLMVVFCIKPIQAKKWFPLEIDVDRVRQSREKGTLRLGQTLKSFRDRHFHFDVYDEGRRFPYLDSLGPIEKPRRNTPLEEAYGKEAPTIFPASPDISKIARMIKSERASSSMKEVKPASGNTFRQYYNVSEYRTKLWYALKDCADGYEQASNPNGERTELLKTTCTAIKELEEIERYWAFPGMRKLTQLKETLDRGGIHGFHKYGARVGQNARE